jgi:hypothetical protein
MIPHGKLQLLDFFEQKLHPVASFKVWIHVTIDELSHSKRYPSEINPFIDFTSGLEPLEIV